MFQFITNNDFITSAKAYISFEGYRCGLNAFDEIMRIDKQTITTLVATPSSGKSTFTNFYGYSMGANNGWRTLYLATETAKNDQAKKLSTLYGSYQQASEHSIILEGSLNDLNELIQAIKAAKQQFNIDMCIIDNFTMLQRLIQGEVNTTNIGKVIAMLKQAAIDTDTAIILVAHPTKLNEGQKVTAYSVNGSANFFNMSDYMFSLEISDSKAMETTINVLKLRDDAKGQMNGKCVLKYDKITRKYSDTDSSTEDTSTEDSDTDSQPATKATPAANNTTAPKGINYPIAREVMKEIEEEAKQAKQEDSQSAATQPAQATPAVKEEVTKQPAGTTKAAPAVQATQPAAPAVKEEVTQQEVKQHITPDFLTNTKVSIMGGHKVLNESDLYNALKMGRMCKEEIEAVRMIDRSKNESEYRQAKAKVLSYTPSCLCTIGGTAKEVEHVNPLIAIDLDEKDNTNISLEEMRKRVNSLPYIMYSSMSVGGRGMYALIPIKEENKNDFKGVFKALESDFKALGLTLDGSCVNVNRERYMSYDDNEYWNKQCEIYTRKINIPTQVHTHPSKVGENAKTTLTEKDKEKVDLMIEDIKANKIQLSKNHKDTLGLANAIANIWGEEGRELFHLIRSQREGYDEYKTDKTFDEMLDKIDDNERYGLGLIFTKYKEAKGQTQIN